MSETLHVNQRVMTPLGPGTILGFETFTPDGFEGPVALIDPGSNARVIVKLDDPSKWIPTKCTPHPYIFRSQLSELKED